MTAAERGCRSRASWASARASDDDDPLRCGDLSRNVTIEPGTLTEIQAKVAAGSGRQEKSGDSLQIHAHVYLVRLRVRGKCSRVTGPGDPGAPREVGQSILITFKHDGRASGRSWRNYERAIVLPLFRSHHAEHEDVVEVHYLRESSLHGLRTVAGNITRSWPIEALRIALSGKRPPRPYRSPILNPSIDLLVKMDLEEPPTERQLDALKMLRAELESAGTVHVAKSTNYRVYEQGRAQDSDTPSGFLTRWRPDSTLEKQDTYWREGHGRYAVSLGFPPSLRSYDQLHHGAHDPGSEVFDAPAVGAPSGWSFEMIAGRHPILMWMIDPRALRANWKLIADERKFTLSPEWLVFERVKLTQD